MAVDVHTLGLFRQQRIGEAVCQRGRLSSGALNHRRVAGELTARDFLAIRSRLLRDRAYWELVEMGAIVLGQAEELVQKTGLRILDALHVASALTFQTASGLTIPFITADMRQRDTAEALALNLIWVA